MSENTKNLTEMEQKSQNKEPDKIMLIKFVDCIMIFVVDKKRVRIECAFLNTNL